MAMDDVKDKLRETFQGIAAQVQESTAWIQLMEKYQNLSPNAQKGVIAGGVSLVTLILFLIPWIFFSSSQALVSDFEDKQNLIRETYRAKRSASALPPPPPPLSSSSLQMSAKSAITATRLQSEQIVSVSDLPPDSIVGVPKTLDQAGVLVTLSKLNLTQVVDVGHELQLIHPMARLVGVEVNATRDNPHFFDVVYKLVAISTKPAAVKGAPGSARKGR